MFTHAPNCLVKSLQKSPFGAPEGKEAGGQETHTCKGACRKAQEGVDICMIMADSVVQQKPTQHCKTIFPQLEIY